MFRKNEQGDLLFY